MLQAIHPKLPMRNKKSTQDFYINLLGFQHFGGDYPEYLMLEKDAIQIHFFLFEDLKPEENYGQVYIRTDDIDTLYAELKKSGVAIHPNGSLSLKPWGMKEFSILDPDHNLLTYGQEVF